MKLYAYKFDDDLKLFTDMLVAMDQRAKDREDFGYITVGDMVFTVHVDTTKHPESE